MVQNPGGAGGGQHSQGTRGGSRPRGAAPPRPPPRRRGPPRWLLRAAVALPLLPLAANSFGWIFTEMGRQPWIVFSQLQTSAGVSPTVSTAEVVTSLTVFTLLYGALAVVEVGLLLRSIRAGLPDVTPPEPVPATDEQPLAFAY
jgi:cytochrome d ubiquinol oxidase subunit I